MTTEQQFCRSCEKPRGVSAKKPGLCPSCAGSLSGRKFRKSNPIQYETVKQKQDRQPTSSWWTTPASFQAHADERAKRMAGNGWTE
jgi:hypothetical protein